MFTPLYLDATDDNDYLPTWSDRDETGGGAALLPLLHDLTAGTEVPNAVIGAPRRPRDKNGELVGNLNEGLCVRCVAARDMEAGEVLVARDPAY
mmetsp:Transcript_30796/g.62820  ORF Transcript_30796/g.62820 Transcript_30796/m.62820 type:complete len:94 (+) Transcript_30796:79-360(+)